MLEGAAFDVDGAFVVDDAADVPTRGAGVFAAHLLGLQIGGRLQGTGSHTPGGGDRHGFHLRQVDVEPRPLLAEGASDGNFSPTPRELSNTLEFRGSQLP